MDKNTADIYLFSQSILIQFYQFNTVFWVTKQRSGKDSQIQSISELEI